MLVDDDVLVSLKNCTVRYGELLALNDVSMEVHRNESIALVGPSGCGKSTLLRTITGAVNASGKVRVVGRSAIIYQDLKLLPWMTVQDNVAMASVQNSPSMDELLAIAGLLDKRMAYPYSLSGGQRQRVAIIRALYGRPDALLLDEPFSALDFVAKAALMRIIQTIRTDQQLTTILVTHDLSDAISIADRILVMRQGRVVKEVQVNDRSILALSATENEIKSLYEVPEHGSEPTR